MTAKAITMAKAALEKIDDARGRIREARSSVAEAESTINLEMARLHAFVALVEVDK